MFCGDHSETQHYTLDYRDCYLHSDFNGELHSANLLSSPLP